MIALPSRHYSRRTEDAYVAWMAYLLNGAGWVEMPGALARKYPNAGREWAWQWVSRPRASTSIERPVRGADTAYTRRWCSVR
jgi:hypothetical protein